MRAGRTVRDLTGQPLKKFERPGYLLMFSGSWRVVCCATVVTFAAFALPASFAQSSLPVVPGGEGFGMTTRAAYGCGSDPAIIRVTNLNDSGAGSLRDALTATGPRVVI